MKIDFHVHGSLSSKLGFDFGFFRLMIAHARQMGLDALALTDHFHAPDYAEIGRVLEREYPYSGDCYEVEGIRVFPGIEVEVSEGPHLLVIGGRESIAAYYQRLAGHLTPGNYCTTAEFFEKQSGLNVLTIFAHPLRPRREIQRIAPEWYPRFQAMDLNGRDLFVLGHDLRARMATLSTETRLPVVAGSDTHHYLQLGTVFNQFHTAFRTVDDLKSQIASGAYTIHVDQDLDQKVERARAAKQAIKTARLGA